MKPRDICVILCFFAYIFIGSAMAILEESEETERAVGTVIDIPEQEIVELAEKTYDKMYTHHELMRFVLDITPVIYSIEPDLEEYTCLMYATEPIGRYYITAYNHLETGSKMTASGATCHEGLITTCAADPRYHKFGEYLEIGGRVYVVEDTGSAVKKRHIDIYFASYKEMARYGSNYQTIYRVSWPFGKPKGV